MEFLNVDDCISKLSIINLQVTKMQLLVKSHIELHTNLSTATEYETWTTKSFEILERMPYIPPYINDSLCDAVCELLDDDSNAPYTRVCSEAFVACESVINSYKSAIGDMIDLIGFNNPNYKDTFMKYVHSERDSYGIK
jgi:hypothetical protein